MIEYAEFKNMCESLTQGNKKTPDDNAFIPIINLAMYEIASRTTPLVLISKDVQDEPLRYIDDVYFVKKPKKIYSNTETIILDSGLIGALAYECCSYFASSEYIGYYNKKRDEIINNFNWNKK